MSRYRDAGEPDQLLVTARDVSDQVALRRQVTHLTFHDGLTGLPNRAYLEERAKDAIDRSAAEPGQPQAQAGAIFLDLDGFTGVNDSVGHGAGDLLLAQAARRLRGCGAAAGHRGPLGRRRVRRAGRGRRQRPGDRRHRRAAGRGHRRRRRSRWPTGMCSLTASVGVALADGGDPGYLLRNADVAMSRAKESGGGRVEVFAAHMHADVVRRLELASDLRRAITERELRLDYQPVVDLATSPGHRRGGAGPLVAGRRAGAARPSSSGVAEDSGLIVPLGDWVLREACAQAAAWRESGWAIGVSVNFSLRQVSAAAVRRVGAGRAGGHRPDRRPR